MIVWILIWDSLTLLHNPSLGVHISNLVAYPHAAVNAKES